MLSLIGFHRTLVGNASIPGDMVYLGKGEGAIASREEGAIAPFDQTASIPSDMTYLGKEGGAIALVAHTLSIRNCADTNISGERIQELSGF